MGPSLSDHLDTASITSNRVYNLSLQGANSTEMRLMAGNVMQNSQIKLLIICLDPYIVRDMDINDERMQPQLKRAALGSTFMVQYYSDLVYSYVTGSSNQFGLYGNLMIKTAPEGPETAIKNFVKFLGDNDMEVPESYYRASVSELKGMVDEAHSRNVRIAAFFFPMPAEVFAVTAKRYISFRKVVSSLFKPEDMLIDFTSPEYARFREDYSNYSDQGHLSEKGARYLVAEIDKAIAARQGR